MTNLYQVEQSGQSVANKTVSHTAVSLVWLISINLNNHYSLKQLAQFRQIIGGCAVYIDWKPAVRLQNTINQYDDDQSVRDSRASSFIISGLPIIIIII